MLDDPRHLVEAFQGYRRTINSILALYLDGIRGFEKLKEEFEISILGEFKHRGLKIPDDINNLAYSYAPEMADGAYTDDVHRDTLHISTIGEFRARNDENGTNYKLLARMCVVTLYQYWEDVYRAKFAKGLGIEKNEVTFPIMGDLRRIRHSIIHHGAIALPDVDKCEIVKWFKPGDEITFTAPQMMAIVRHTQMSLYVFLQQHPKIVFQDHLGNKIQVSDIWARLNDSGY